MIEIGPLRREDRAAWEVLARGYKAFYREPEPDEAYERTWQRDHPLRVSPVARPEVRRAAALTPSMNSPTPNR